MSGFRHIDSPNLFAEAEKGRAFKPGRIFAGLEGSA
jgi:hypothetical protein